MNAVDQVFAASQLRAVWKQKSKHARRTCFGIDRVSAQAFEARLESNVRALQRRRSEGYKPDGLLAIPKLKPDGRSHRVICVPHSEASICHCAEAVAARLNGDAGTDLNTGSQLSPANRVEAGYTKQYRQRKQALEQTVNTAGSAASAAGQGGHIARPAGRCGVPHSRTALSSIPFFRPWVRISSRWVSPTR